MRSKKIILSVIVTLTITCLALAWFIFRGLTEEEILQSSSYADMFGSESVRRDVSPMESGIAENMILDIVRISNEINGTATATVNITIPDVASVFIETIESFPNMQNVSETIFNNRMIANMQNYTITLRREFDVVQQGGEWQIANREDIDRLISEQQTALFIKMLEYSDFEPMALPTF